MLGLCRGKRACRPASLGGGCRRAAGAAPRQVHPPEARAASIERPAGRCAGSGRRGEQLRLLAAGGGLFRVSGELPAELSAPKELFLAPLQRRSSEQPLTWSCASLFGCSVSLQVRSNNRPVTEFWPGATSGAGRSWALGLGRGYWLVVGSRCGSACVCEPASWLRVFCSLTNYKNAATN